MGYSLEEHLESGDKVVLGEPFADLRIAKVIASQRALRTGRVVVVCDREKGTELARYQPNGAPVVSSVKRMRVFDDQNAPPSQSEPRRKTSA